MCQDSVADSSAPNEVVEAAEEAQVRAADITAPLKFVGGSGGTRLSNRGWTTGKVITRIRLYSGHATIKAYTIWFTDSASTTYGDPGSSNYAEYPFENGERLTSLTLWGNGNGTRAGWLEFTTTKGRKFSYGMTGWDRETPYHAKVASGILVGCIFNAGSDIDAHGFWCLNDMSGSELVTVRYPTLTFDTIGIAPKVMDRFQYQNNSTSPKDWDFTRSMTETVSQTWATTVDVTVHATITVTAGIPLVAEVSGEFGWQVGVTTHRETTNTSEQVFSWSVKGTVQPGDRVDLKAITRVGTSNIPYTGTMVVSLRNGATFSYPMNGQYIGVNYTGVEVVDDSTR